MGFSRYAIPQQGTIVRTGEERATLIRRTYSLVFASILVTVGAVAFAMTQPAMMQAVSQHPIITFICAFIPLMLAQRARASFPQNIGFVFLFTFAMGLYVAPFIAFAEQHSPGISSQAGLLTFTAFGTLTMYSFLSRRDFSAWRGFLVVGLVVLTFILLALLLVQYPLGWLMPDIHGGMKPGAAMSFHVSLGIVILLFIIARLVGG